MMSGQIAKVDKRLGVVLGWGIISKRNGAPYFDTQGDHIPEDAMLEAAAEFMASARTVKANHAGDGIGTVLFAYPMTEDIARAMGVRTDMTGLMVGIKPNDPAILEKFSDGTFSGFSIGGQRVQDEEVSE